MGGKIMTLDDIAAAVEKLYSLDEIAKELPRTTIQSESGFQNLPEGSRVQTIETSTGLPTEGYAYPQLGQVSTLPSPLSQAPKQQSSPYDIPGSFAQGTKRGVAGLLGFPVDVTNSLMGAVTGNPQGLVNQPTGGSGSILNAFNKMGIPDYNSPKSVMNNIAGAVGEQVPSLMIPMGLGARAGTGVLKAGATVTPSLIGAGTASGLSRTLAPDNLVADLVSTVLGGAVGAGSTAFVQKLANPNLHTKINRTLNAVAKPTQQEVKNSGQSFKQFQQGQTNAVTGFALENKKTPFRYKNETGAVIKEGLPDTRMETLEAIDQYKARIYKNYNDKAKAAGEQGLSFDGNDIGTRIELLANDPNLPPSAKAAGSYLKDQAAMYRQYGPMSPTNLEEELATVNARIKAQAKNPNPNEVSRANADMQLAAVLRNELDKGITRVTGDGYQDFRNQYGNVRILQDRMARASLTQLKDEAKIANIPFSDAFWIAEMGASVMSGHPKAALLGGGVMGVRHGIKWLQNPDRRLKSMFRTVDRIVPKPEKFEMGERTFAPNEQKMLTQPFIEGEIIGNQKQLPPLPTNRLEYTGRTGKPAIDADWNPVLNTGKKPVTTFGKTVYDAAPFDFDATLKNMTNMGWSPVEARDHLLRQIKAELSKRNK